MINLQLDERVARLTLGHAPVNAFSPELLHEFHAALDRLQARDDWRVLLIASSLKVFSAGGELERISGWLAQPDAGARVAAYGAEVQRLNARIEALQQPSIAECA